MQRVDMPPYSITTFGFGGDRLTQHGVVVVVPCYFCVSIFKRTV